MVRIKSAANNSIKGVFFDYGGVLEDLVFSERDLNKGIAIIQKLLEEIGINLSQNELKQLLKKGLEEYNLWFEKNDYKELPCESLWCDFLLKPALRRKGEKKKLETMAENLSSIYEYYMFKRRPAKHVKEVLKTLFYAGYKISVISNTMSRTLIPERLKKFGLDGYITDIVLSSKVGVRKPNRIIFESALEYTGVSPQQCIYIGDTLSRDVQGSKKSGFKYSILVESKLTKEKDKNYRGNYEPDFIVKDLVELLYIFDFQKDRV